MTFGEAVWVWLGGVGDDHGRRGRSALMTVSDSAAIPAPAPAPEPSAALVAALASAVGITIAPVLSSHSKTAPATTREGLHSFPTIPEMESFGLLGRGGPPILDFGDDGDDDELYRL
jgi:hypothetical protein